MGTQNTLPGLLAEAAAVHPDRVAVAVDGVDRLTYRAWEERSNDAAGGLQGHGVASGDRVALVFDAHGWCDYAVAYLAVHKVGAAAVPLVAGAGPVTLGRALRVHAPSAVVAHAALAPPQAAVPALRPRHLEAAGRTHPPYRRPGSFHHGEILSRLQALSAPVVLPRSGEDVISVPPWAEQTLGPSLLHTFAPGTAAGQDILRAALAPSRAGSMVLPTFDADRPSHLLAQGHHPTCVLHPATAGALLDSGATARYDLAGVARVVLVGGPTSPALLTALAEALPQAVLQASDAAAPRPHGGRPPAQPTSAPVASSQEGMIWHEHLTPGCQNLPGLARRYRGPLDVAALDRALDEIVRRHESLRTTFELRHGRLLQIVRPHHRTRLPVHDLRDLPVDEREEEVARRVAEAGLRPFDLTDDAVFTAALLRLADDDHVLVIRTHHSVFDDWSVGVFRRELVALYTAFTAGETSPLSEPPRFTHFARTQRDRLAGRAGERETTFWRRELDGAPFTVQLPVDDPARPVGSPQTAGEPVRLSLPPDLHHGLRALARGQRATVFMTMLAAYAVLVHRYTGQDDLLLATVVANRQRTELEGVIGCFTKKVPLRLRLDGDPTFSEVLARTRAALLGALTHQDLPFEAVVQDVLGAPAAAHGLVPHVVLVFQGETPRRELVLPGLDTTGLETAATARRAHFMGDDGQPAERGPAEPWGAGLYLGTFVILSVAESDEQLSCVARGAFHGPAVRLLLDTYRSLLSDVVADPSRRVAELALLDGPGRAEAVARGQGRTAAIFETTAGDAFDALARRDPQAVAVRGRDRDLTRAELAQRADRLAGSLQAAGVEAGSTVGVATGPGADAVVAALAAWKAGAAWVGLDPQDGEERLARIMTETSTTVVVGEDPRGVLARHARVVAVDADGTMEARASLCPASPAVVFYGGGPSAMHRGVMLDHRSVLALTAAMDDVWGADGTTRRVCLTAPPTGVGFLRQLVALLAGHALTVPGRPRPARPASTVGLVARGHVDVLDCTPAELAGLLDAGLVDALERREPGAVRPVLVVGTSGPVDPATWAAARSIAGARGVVLYGPPECAFAATAARVADFPRPVVGRPLAGVEAHVLDSRGNPVPPRARGELHVGGATLAAGHAGGSPAGAFVQGALDGASTRLYRTGNHARRLPDGTVELLGRVDAETDLRGFAVDPARVESALAGCPGTRDVAVTMHRDDRGAARLVAYVTPDGPPPSIAALRARIWARLPGYACPSAMVLVDGAQPGDRGDLRSLPEPATVDDGTAESAVLTALWADVLGADRVGPGQNYWQQFSFLEVLARAHEVGLAVTGEHVARNRTVETLAADLAAHRNARTADGT